MFNKFGRCVIFHENIKIYPLLSNNTTNYYKINYLDFNLYSSLKNKSQSNVLTNESGKGVSNTSSTNKLQVLRAIYYNLYHNLKDNHLSGNLDKQKEIRNYYSLMDEVLVSLEDNNEFTGKVKEKIISILIKITRLKDDNELNNKVQKVVSAFLVSSDPGEVVKILKIFIKHKYPLAYNDIVYKLTGSEELETDLLFDLYWCLVSLDADSSHLGKLLEKLLVNVENTNLVSNLKFLNSLYSLYSRNNLTSAENNLILSNNDLQYEPQSQPLKSESSLPSFCLGENDKYTDIFDSLTDEEMIKSAVGYVKGVLIRRIKEFDTTRALCNFIFYVTSTINNFSIVEYGHLIHKLKELLNGNSEIAIQGIIQLLWSLQKNNIYPQELLQMLKYKFHEMLETNLNIPQGSKRSEKLNVGHISLALYSLTYFNILDYDLSVLSIKYLNRLNVLSTTNKDQSRDVLKEVNILWSICLSNIFNINSLYKDIVNLLNNLDWTQFSTKSQFEDLRKVLQILTVLKFEKELDGLEVPEMVMKMVNNSRSTTVDYKVNSVTQDKVRRVLKSNGISFESECHIDSQILVDFLVSPRTSEGNSPSDSFDEALELGENNTEGLKQPRKKLIIEIDGPYHYNIVLDNDKMPDDLDYITFGRLKLVLNGKTIYRNEVLRRFGYNVESIPWFTGYQKSFYDIIQKILVRYQII